MKLILIGIFLITACHRNKPDIEQPQPTPTPVVEEPTPTPPIMPPVPTATPIPTVTPTPEPTPELPRAVCEGQGPVTHKIMDWGVLQLRMQPCETAAIPVIATTQDMNEKGFVSVVFTQGQQPSLPPGTTTEFTVSKTPGLIDSSNPYCYHKSTLDNYNAITIYTKPKPSFGWIDQASLGAYGCWAPASEGQWYVNVRWAYHTCPHRECGYSMQWSSGGW